MSLADEVEFKDYKEEHFDAIFGILLNGLKEHYENPHINMWREGLSNLTKKSKITVIFLGKIIVGFFARKKHPKFNNYLLQDTHIHEKYRRGGIGERIIRTFEYEAIENGFQKVSLYVLERNTEAIRLYKRLGFKEKEYFKDEEKGYHKLYMEKKL